MSGKKILATLGFSIRTEVLNIGFTSKKERIIFPTLLLRAKSDVPNNAFKIKFSNALLPLYVVNYCYDY